jgi:hypothetical protein
MNETDENPLNYPVERAATRIGVGRTMMFSLMRTEPELRPIHIGRRTLIPSAGIDAFLERKIRERDSVA